MSTSLNEYFTEWVLLWMVNSLNEYFTEWVLHWISTLPFRWGSDHATCNTLKRKRKLWNHSSLASCEVFSMTSHFTYLKTKRTNKKLNIIITFAYKYLYVNIFMHKFTHITANFILSSITRPRFDRSLLQISLSFKLLDFTSSTTVSCGLWQLFSYH